MVSILNPQMRLNACVLARYRSMSEISGSMSVAAQLSAHATRYDWQPPAVNCSKITLSPECAGPWACAPSRFF
jgi:hypothetical protein